MLKPRHIIALMIAVTPGLGGCGTTVPQIQEFNQSAEQGKTLVQSIVTNITCEVQDAVAALYANRHSTFMDKWGAQINLILTIEEKSAVSPNVGWSPNKIFSLGAGVSGSGDATRIDKINSFYTIRELRDLEACDRRLRPGGELLLANDLKLTEWLANAVTAGDTGEIRFSNSAAFKDSGVISHEVRFEVITSGTLNPSWTLSRVISVNPVVPFFSASRDRTHDLIITLGPTDMGGTRPAPTALNAALASEVGASFVTSVRNAIGP